MRIEQQIKRKLNTRSSINVAYILEQIEKYDVISFDIFDTLLKRNVSTPIKYGMEKVCYSILNVYNIRMKWL